jgi:hypothetical protein
VPPVILGPPLPSLHAGTLGYRRFGRKTSIRSKFSSGCDFGFSGDSAVSGRLRPPDLGRRSALSQRTFPLRSLAPICIVEVESTKIILGSETIFWVFFIGLIRALKGKIGTCCS